MTKMLSWKVYKKDLFQSVSPPVVLLGNYISEELWVLAPKTQLLIMLSKQLVMICLIQITCGGSLETVGEVLGEKVDILDWRCTILLTKNVELIAALVMEVDAKVIIPQFLYAENAVFYMIIVILLLLNRLNERSYDNSFNIWYEY